MRIGLGEYGSRRMFPSVAQRETEWRPLDFGEKRDFARIISQLDGDMFSGRRKICFQTENGESRNIKVCKAYLTSKLVNLPINKRTHKVFVMLSNLINSKALLFFLSYTG